MWTAVQLEHLEADDADRDPEAAEKLVHALQSRVDSGTDEHYGNLPLLLFAFQLPLHELFDAAELPEAELQLLE